MAVNCRTECWKRGWKIGLMVLAGIAAMSWVVMMLWNWLVPALFSGGREIGYLQATGVLLLSKILFGGFRGHGCRGRWHTHRRERMTPEEREKFQAEMRGCGGGRYRQEEVESAE
jgi:hypothetical protein